MCLAALKDMAISQPIPQFANQIVEPIATALGSVPVYNPDPALLKCAWGDGGVGHFIQRVEPINVADTTDELAEFLQGIDFLDQSDDVVSVASDVLDDMYLMSPEEAENLVANMFDDISADHGANVVADFADDAANVATDLADDVANVAVDLADDVANVAVDLADDVANVAADTANVAADTANVAADTANVAADTANVATDTANVATGVAQGLMDKVPWTDISQQNIIGQLGEKCLRSRCIDIPQPQPVGGPVSVPFIAPVMGALSGYMKAKETGSVKAGVVKGTVVTGTSYLVSSYLAPVCLANPEPASKVFCFGFLAGFSYFGGSVGDAVADSFVEP